LPEACEFVKRLPSAGESKSELFRRAIKANRRFADAQRPVVLGN
jgi:hypothetical protein